MRSPYLEDSIELPIERSARNDKVTAHFPSDLILGDVYIKIHALLAHSVVNLKLECFSAGGSIKTKTARQMIEQLERAGKIGPHTRLIESSSGNLGLALSIIAAERGYRFTCVSDPNISPQTARLMRVYGAEVVLVERRDANGGYLASRIDYINSRLAADPNLVWLNQYANPANPAAHEHLTGEEILAAFPRPDFLFVATGTTGTLTGVSRAMREKSPLTRIVAVDSLGSVTFGTKAGPRFIPGAGSSRRPEIASEDAMDDLELVPEADTIVMCRRLAAKGLMLGGSTGMVLSALTKWSGQIPRNSCVVAISPDMGDRYLDSIYDDAWVESHFPGVLSRCRDAIARAPLFWQR
jgi:cysteine synthase A